MTQSRATLPDHFTIHWPEPAHLRLETMSGVAEPCEIQFNDGTVEHGELLRFTGRDEHVVFRPHAGHPRYPSKIVVKTSRFKRLRLKNFVGARPLDATLVGSGPASSQIQVYNVEFADHEIESGNTSGYVRNAIGLFLFFGRPGDLLERVFIPEAAIAYFQAGDPIGRMLVEEQVVSEEQLKAAVEKQQEMRKLVLGDYLIEEGLITPQQLDLALVHQSTKPSLRLGEALIELGFVQPDALQIVLSRQRANRGRPLGQILVDMGVVDHETLNKVQAKKLGKPFVSLANFTPSSEAVQVLAGSVVRRLGVMPLSVEHGDLIVATETELDTSAMNELTLLSRMRVMQVMASGAEIRAAQSAGYGEGTEEIFLADSSGVRFGSAETIDGFVPVDDDALTSAEGVELSEPVAGLSHTQLIAVIERALRAVETGGRLDIQSETIAGERTTRIRLTRD